MKEFVFVTLLWMTSFYGSGMASGAVKVVAGKRPSTKAPPPQTTAAEVTYNGGAGRATGGHSALNELLRSIFDEYHKELSPNRPTVVKMDLLILKVKSTIEKEGIFESVIALFMTWKDPRMTWEPKLYENINSLAFDSEKLWLPDVAMTNSADHLYSISKDTRFVVRVNADGTMKFVPTGTARTWCDLRLLEFPFDTQTCSFEFESWSLDNSVLTFDNGSAAVVDDGFSSPQWALCGHYSVVYNHFYNFTGETFTRVRYDFTIRRKSTFYVINLIFPVFVIPSTDSTSDRVGFGTTNMLTLVVFQTIVTEELPKTSDAVTALSKYIIALILTSSVGIFQSVVLERLLRATTEAPPKWAIRMMAMVPLFWGSQMPSGINQMILEGGIGGPKGPKEKKSIKKGMQALANIIKKDGSNSNVNQKGNDIRKRGPGFTPNKPALPNGKVNDRAADIANRLKNGIKANGAALMASETNKKLQELSPALLKGKLDDVSAFIEESPLFDRRIDERSAFRYARNPPLKKQQSDSVLSDSLSGFPTEKSRQGSADSYENHYDHLSGGLMVDVDEMKEGNDEDQELDRNYDDAKSTVKPFIGNPFGGGANNFSKFGQADESDDESEESARRRRQEESEEEEEEIGEDAAREQIVRAHINNGIKWGRLITKVDHLTFLICLGVSIGSPVLLFIPPLLAQEGECDG